MQTKKLPKSSVSLKLKNKVRGAVFIPRPERTLEWLGGVSYQNLENTLGSIKSLMREDPLEEIQLVISSYGGASGIGMSFYDTIRTVLKPKLVTIGSGDVDSSGLIIFLAGERRYLTKNTTMLLHLAGRTFAKEKRYSTRDIETMLKEDKLKDYQYACILSDATSHRYSPERILEMMANETILTAQEAVQMGLAHKVLS